MYSITSSEECTQYIITRKSHFFCWTTDFVLLTFMRVPLSGSVSRYHRVYRVYSRPNWVLPPLTCKSVLLPHLGQRGETHSLAEGEVGGPIIDDRKDTLVLYLCYCIIPLRSIHIYMLEHISNIFVNVLYRQKKYIYWIMHFFVDFLSWCHL